MSNNETLIDINNTGNTEQQTLENYLIKLINWKYLFIFLITITLLSAMSLNKLYKYFKEINIYTPYGLDMISFFGYGIIINMFIITFSISFYFNVKQTKGFRGNFGNIGKKGPPGKDSYCDICTLKPIGMKRPYKFKETNFVDVPPTSDILEENERGWKIVPFEQQDNYIFNANNNCSETVELTENKYLVGIISKVSKENGIKQLQFIFRDKDNKTVRLPENKIPENSDNYNNYEIIISEAPINYGIYKIEFYKENKILVGMKLFFKNYMDGTELDSQHKTIGKTDNNKTTISLDNNSFNGNKYVRYFSNLICNYNNEGICRIEFTDFMFNLDNNI